MDGTYNTYHVDQGHAEEVVAVPHDAYIGYEVLRLSFTSSPTDDVSLSADLLSGAGGALEDGHRTPHIEPRFRLLAESDSDNNLVSIFASDSEDLERHAYEVVEEFGGGGDAEQQGSDSISTSSAPRASALPRWHFALLSDGLLMTTRDLADLVNKPVFLAVREDASPYYVRDRVFRINVYNNTRLSKVRFNQPSAIGHLPENALADSLVEGLSTLRLIDGEAVVDDGSVLFALIENDYGAEDEWAFLQHPLEPTANSQDQSARLHAPSSTTTGQHYFLHHLSHHHQHQNHNNDNNGNNNEPFRLANSTSTAILSNRPLDRELKPFYDFILSARSLDNSFFAQIPLRIHLDDENDNAPVFERALYEFYIAHDTPLYSLIGNVSATDADDSDSVIYHLTERHPHFVIVPKTGQLMLIKSSVHVPHRFEFEVYATDDRVGGGSINNNRKRSSQPVPVIVEVYREETYDDDANEDGAAIESSADGANNSGSLSTSSASSSTSEEQPSNAGSSEDNSETTASFDLELLQQQASFSSADDHEEAVVGRARAKREIRHTKTYEFKESDGATPGMVVFQLDKQSPSETFRLEHPSKWVVVEATGAVKVKEPWDYEQLGKDKTVDFWVECLPNGGE